MSGSDKGQRRIQSLDAAGQLLLALGRSPTAMALKDLAREAGMSASKAHPYLVSFCRLGLVEQDARSGHYDLGKQALRLGLTALQRLDPLAIAKAELEGLPVDKHFSRTVSVWANQGPTIVHFIEADYPLHVFIRSGTVLSLAYTAAGIVFSAFMPRAVIEAALESDRYRLSGRPTPLTMAALDRLTQEVRERGISRNVNAAVPGVNSISAPVFDHEGRLALAVSVMRPGLSTDADPDGDLAEAARTCAARISARLGFAASARADLSFTAVEPV